MVTSTPLGAAAADTASPRQRAKAILAAAGVRGGLIVHVGCGDGELTAALRVSDSYTVQGLSADPGVVERARRQLRAAGVYGGVSVERFDGKRLPYIDNLVNLIVAEDLGAVSMAEVMRALCPGGVAQVKASGRWTRTVKGRPGAIDEWTHWLHGPDGNAVADDRTVGPPRRAQWIAEPRWQRHHESAPSVDAMVSAGGRLFAIVNEALPGIDGLPDRWALLARDAFNGKLLWKRPIAEWGPSAWSDHSYGNGRWNQPTHIARRLVAVGDRVYVTLGFNATLTALDAATGRTVMTYPDARFTDEVLFHEGTLVLTVNDAAQGPGRIAAKPPVGKSIVALDARTGKRLWKTGGFVGVASKADAIERITHLNMVLGSGKVVVTEADAVVALDLATGRRAWGRPGAPRKKVVTYGNYYFGNLCSLVAGDGVVLLTEPDSRTKHQAWNAAAKSIVSGLSAETGEVLWTRPCGIWGHYGEGDLFIIDGLAWVHEAGTFAMVGLDPRTGKVKRTLSTKAALDQGHHHRCYRNKATTRYIVTGRRGVELIDVASAETRRHHWVRGTCRYGVLPANGLLYAPPHPCICYITAKLNGFWALAPAFVEASAGRPASEGSRLEKGPAYGAVNPQSPTRNPPSSPWPTYRHDAARSGCAGTTVPNDLQTAWRAPIGGRLSAPVIAGGKVFVAAVDSHTVYALGEADGEPAWQFTAGGRVDTPPTVHRGLALFGSADGWVYCLRAADGALVWRLRAAPRDVRMMDHGQLASPWPVHGSVLVQGGVAYFAAGRSSFLDGGIHVYAVDPATGKVLHHKPLDSYDPETGDMVKCRLAYDMPPDAPGALPDVFVGDGRRVYMRHLKFGPAGLDVAVAFEAPAAKAAKRRNPPPVVTSHLLAGAGLLDDSWFTQAFWTLDGKAHSKLLAFDAKTAYGVKLFAATRRHTRAIFRPGTKGYTLFASGRPKHTKRWTRQVPVRMVAMVLAEPTLLVAGPPDVVDPDDPWAGLDGRAGGVVWLVSAADGEKLAEVALEAPPVFDGMAAANGSVYISTTDGKVLRLGKSR